MAKNGCRRLDLAAWGFRADDGCDFQTATFCGTSALAPWKRAASITGKGESFRSRNVRLKSWRRCAVRHAFPTASVSRSRQPKGRACASRAIALVRWERFASMSRRRWSRAARAIPTSRQRGRESCLWRNRIRRLRPTNRFPSRFPNGSPRSNARNCQIPRFFLRKRKIV